MARSSGSLSLAPSLYSLPRPFRLSLSPFSFPPPKSSLPCASGRRFRKQIRSRFRTRKTGAGEEEARFGLEPRDTLRRRRGRRRTADGSQFAVQVLIALVEEGFNRRFFFLFFFKGETFSALCSLLKPGLAQFQTPPSRKRERTGDRGTREGEGERKGKKSPRTTVRICNKELGAGAIPGTKVWSVSVPSEAAGLGSGWRPRSFPSPRKPTSRSAF